MSRRPRTVLLLWLSAPAWSAAADQVYHFVDENGVPHYSNVPADPRYKPLGRTGAAIGAPPPPGALAPVPATTAPLPTTTAPLAPVPMIPSGDPLPPDEGDDDR